MSLSDEVNNNIFKSHQFLDADSLKYIKINVEPVMWATPYISERFWLYMKNHFQPESYKSEWYVDQNIAKGIHGINHALRTAVNICMLVFTHKIHINIPALVYAAFRHDCGRLVDTRDANHGMRSAQLVSSDPDFSSSPISRYRKEIIASIQLHNQDYKEIKNTETYKENKIAVELLKTADALDRYRLPRKDWWAKDEYLRIVPSDIERRFAYHLMQEMEFDYLSCGNSIKAINHAMGKMKDPHI